MSKEVNVFLFDESGRQINQWTNLRKMEIFYNSDNKIKHISMKTINGTTLLLMPATNNTVIIEIVEDDEK